MLRPKSLTYRYEHLEAQQNHNVFIEEYFSGPDTRIFFDGEEQFEISSLSFSVQEQLKPIYGYASRTFDDVAVGSRVILGQFTVPLGNHINNNFEAKTYNENRPIPSNGYIERPSWVEDIETYTSHKPNPSQTDATPDVARTVTYYYTSGKTPIYLAPMDHLPSLSELSENEMFEVIEELEHWVQIKTAQTSGFVKKDSLF